MYRFTPLTARARVSLCTTSYTSSAIRQTHGFLCSQLRRNHREMQSEGTSYGYSYGYGAFSSAPYSAPLQFPAVGYGALRGYPNSSTVAPPVPSDFQAANPAFRPPDAASSFYHSEASAAQSRRLKRPRQELEEDEGDGGSESPPEAAVAPAPQPMTGLGAPHTSLFRPIDFEGATSNFDDAVEGVKRAHLGAPDVSRRSDPQTHYLPTPPQSERGVSPPDSLPAASPAPPPPSHGVTVSLSNEKVWESFAAVGNEMIVTKLGR